jgi:uncharacterized protein (TIGR02145 family)
MKIYTNQWHRTIAISSLLLVLSINCDKPEDSEPAAQLPSLITSAISSITETTATSGGEIISDGGAAITKRGVCWSINENPTIADSNTSISSGTIIFAASLLKLTSGTTYHVRAFATNSAGTGYGNDLSFTTNKKTGGPTTATDADGNTYNTVNIGSQVWMKENLKTTKYSDGTPITQITDSVAWKNSTTGAYAWYKNTDTVFGSHYGAQYNWYAVNTGKLCPAGWHVPSEDEWATLENYLISNGYNYDGTTNGDRESNNKIAKSLADINGWEFTVLEGRVGNTDYPAKRNAAGFTAIPTGYRDFYGSFKWRSYDEVWWSSSEIVPGATTVYIRQINFNYSNVLRAHYEKYYGLSVRCVKD